MFRRSLTIQRTTRAERTILRNDVLTRMRRGRIVDTPFPQDRLREIAREQFEIELPRTLLFEEAEPSVGL